MEIVCVEWELVIVPGLHSESGQIYHLNSYIKSEINLIIAYQ